MGFNSAFKGLMAVTNIKKANPSIWSRVVSCAQMDRNQTVACRKRIYFILNKQDVRECNKVQSWELTSTVIETLVFTKRRRISLPAVRLSPL